MDLYAVVKVIHTIENRIYDFGIPWAAPYEEVYKALEDIKAQVVQMEENAKALAAKQSAEKSQVNTQTDAGVSS